MVNVQFIPCVGRDFFFFKYIVTSANHDWNMIKKNFLGSGRKFQIQLFKIEFYIYLYNMSFCSPFLCLLIKIQINTSIVQYIYGFTYKTFMQKISKFLLLIWKFKRIDLHFFFIYHMIKEIEFTLINVI